MLSRFLKSDFQYTPVFPTRQQISCRIKHTLIFTPDLLDATDSKCYLKCCRRSGEIGRHTILRGWRLNGCAGSSPAFGTNTHSVACTLNLRLASVMPAFRVFVTQKYTLK